MDILTNIFNVSFSSRKRQGALTMVSVQATNIPPKETVLYTKQTQTTSSGGGPERDGKLPQGVFGLRLIVVWSSIFFTYLLMFYIFMCMDRIMQSTILRLWL